MSEITTLRELFLHELGDILYVERALVDEALPKLIGEVQDEEFRDGLEKHLKQTRQHVVNVESVFESLGEEPELEPCLGFKGLKKEHEKMVERDRVGANRSRRCGCRRAHRELRDRGIRVAEADGERARRGEGR